MSIDALHYTPSDGYFGDAMPLYHDGIYHVYYTKAYKNGGMCWGHISTRDLIDWTEHPDPFPKGEIGSPICTGCVIFADGLFHAYYGGKTDNGHPLVHATSEDGITFKWDGKIAVDIPADEKYYRKDGTWRDPHVFYDDENKRYLMVFCTKSPRVDGKPDCFPGSVGQAESYDLINWKLLPPFDEAGVCTSTECPDIFRIDSKRWAMIYYWHETRIRIADTLSGPWRRTEVLSPDEFDFMAAKRMYDGKRHINVGWIPRRSCDCCKRIWGGNMLFPRELSFAEDGTPMSKFAPEVRKIFKNRVEVGLKPSRGEWQITDKSVSVDSHNGGSFAMTGKTPAEYLVSADITISSPETTLIMFVNMEPLEEGYQLIFDIADGMLRLREHYIWDQRNDIAAIPLKVTSDKPFHIDAIVHGDIIEVCVDDKRTLVSRITDHTSGSFALSVQDGKVSIDNLNMYTR